MDKLPHFSEEHLLAQHLRTPYALETYEKTFIGDAIKKLRKKAGMSQADLAKKLKTTQSVVARIEMGKQNLTLQSLVKISFILGKKLHVRFL